MGVNTRYLLNNGNSFFLGPAAYYELRRVYESYFTTSRGRVSIGHNTPIQLPKSWRKAVPILYSMLRVAGHFSQGALRVIKTRAIKKEPVYRDAIAWLRINHPRQQSPRI